MSEPTAINIFDVTEIAVTLSYPFPGVAPITFYLRPYLQKEEEAIRQARFALTDEQRKASQYQHNLDMLASLSTKAPEGVPGWNGSKGDAGETLKRLLKEETPMRAKVVADALTRYYTVTQPAEFFRGL